MRVSYAPKEAQNEEDAPIYQRIAERRKPRPLIPLDLALLQSPPVADGWNSFIGAIRTKTTLSDSVKELAISRVAILNSAVHEWNIHAALALKAGVSAEGIQTLIETEAIKKGDKVTGEDGAGLTAQEWAVVAYTDQMTKGVEVDDGVAKTLRGFFGDREVVELTATVAAYNCVSRFLVALDVGENNGHPFKTVQELQES